MSTRTRFEKEAKGNSEMVYYNLTRIVANTSTQVTMGKNKRIQ